MVLSFQYGKYATNGLIERVACRLYDIMIILSLLCSMDCMTIRYRNFILDARWTVVLGVCVLDQRQELIGEFFVSFDRPILFVAKFGEPKCNRL